MFLLSFDIASPLAVSGHCSLLVPEFVPEMPDDFTSGGCALPVPFFVFLGYFLHFVYFRLHCVVSAVFGKVGGFLGSVQVCGRGNCLLCPGVPRPLRLFSCLCWFETVTLVLEVYYWPDAVQDD